MTAQPARFSLLSKSLALSSLFLSRLPSSPRGSVSGRVSGRVSGGVSSDDAQVGQPVAREAAFCRLRMHRMCVSAWCDCACHVRVAA